MKKGKTASGFEYEVDAELFLTWDFIDVVGQMAEATDEVEQIGATRKYVAMVLGKNIDNLKAFLLEKTGKPAMFVDMLGVAKEIVDSCKDLKN